MLNRYSARTMSVRSVADATSWLHLEFPEDAVLENVSSSVSRPSPVGLGSTAMRVSCAIGSDCRTCRMECCK